MSKRRRERQEAEQSRPWAWHRSVFLSAMAGGLLLYAAFPPLGCWPAAWIAPLFWLRLVERPDFGGRSAWWGLWGASFVHWLLMLQGIRLAHWANHFGWIALAAYLAIYLPLFVLLARFAVQRLAVPLAIAAPVVWTGLELARGHLLTGFSMALLGHTQIGWVSLIQIADLCGAYAVSFLVMLGAACALRTLPLGRTSWNWRPAAVGVAAVALAVVYGQFRLREGRSSATAAERPLKVALLQGAVDKVFEYDPQHGIDSFRQYWQLAQQARDAHPDLDLVIWPESAFSGGMPELIVEGPLVPPTDVSLTAEEFRSRFESGVKAFRNKARTVAEQLNRVWRDGQFQQANIHMLVGTETVASGQGRMEDYNAALLIDPRGEILDRYYKMHPVMFGEYVPFGRTFPWLYRLTPLRQGLTPGTAPRAFEVGRFRLTPSICFESTVPHLIRGQIVRLIQQGTRPDLLVNVTDDGWFWGSSILDLQLACAAFRAVELRRPFLVAANTGISAVIDGSGVILQRGARREKQVLVAEVRVDCRWSGYQLWGDLPAGVCLAACLGLLLGCVSRRIRIARGRRAVPRPGSATV